MSTTTTTRTSARSTSILGVILLPVRIILALVGILPQIIGIAVQTIGTLLIVVGIIVRTLGLALRIVGIVIGGGIAVIGWSVRRVAR